MWPYRWAAFSIAIVMAATVGTACRGSTPTLTGLLEARRIAAGLHVAFSKASEASSRAVMASSDEVSRAAADEARKARQDAERSLAALQPVLESLGYQTDPGHLTGFKTGFDEYRRLDDEILTLAVENSNVKAQRIAFGPSREAVESFTTSLGAAIREGAKDRCRAESLALRAQAAVLQIEVLQPPHIADAEDAVMTRLEEEMRASEAVARKSVDELKAAIGPAAAPHLAAATAALDGFLARNKEIVVLSRRNSNVRSLALSLGRKRAVTAQCEDHLRALGQALEEHRFNATR
jgi:hypothetical protein